MNYVLEHALKERTLRATFWFSPPKREEKIRPYLILGIMRGKYALKREVV